MPENLPPRRWAADDVPVRADGDFLGKLALGRQVSRDVLVIRSDALKMFSATFVGIKHSDRLAILAANRLDGSDLIRIPSNKHEAIGAVVRRIDDSRDREIDIGPLLLHLVDLDQSIRNDITRRTLLVHWRNPHLGLGIKALHNLDTGKSCYRLNIGILTLCCRQINWMRLDRSRKIPDFNKFKATSHKRFGELPKVEPFPRSSFQKPEILIISINIDNRFLHSPYMLRPRPCGQGLAPPRLNLAG